MVRDILFDLDDTLFDFHADERAALEKTLASLQLPADDAVCARYSEINQAQWKALERGEITRAQVKLRRFELLLAELGQSPELAVQAAGIYQERLSQGYHFMDGAPELLEALSGRYRMFLVSNGTLSVQEGRLKKAGIGHYFADILSRSSLARTSRANGFSILRLQILRILM